MRSLVNHHPSVQSLVMVAPNSPRLSAPTAQGSLSAHLSPRPPPPSSFTSPSSHSLHSPPSSPLPFERLPVSSFIIHLARRACDPWTSAECVLVDSRVGRDWPPLLFFPWPLSLLCLVLNRRKISMHRPEGSSSKSSRRCCPLYRTIPCAALFPSFPSPIHDTREIRFQPI